jgi:hypothetical protein
MVYFGGRQLCLENHLVEWCNCLLRYLSNSTRGYGNVVGGLALRYRPKFGLQFVGIWSTRRQTRQRDLIETRHGRIVAQGARCH